MEEFKEIISRQRNFFKKFHSFSYAFRMKRLKLLKACILKYEDEILEALRLDLSKSRAEAFMTEVSIVLSEIRYFERHLKTLMKAKKVASPMLHFKSKSYLLPRAYGSVLILSPWNYPFQLSFLPLIGAVAAGNCVLLKPSEYSVETSKLVAKIVRECFHPAHVAVLSGGAKEAEAILREKFDYIFFTGNAEIGKIVMKAAAEHLTPLTLELGGKSPCIVDRSCKADLAAKRIMWGKLMNAGQTCIAVDYIYVHSEIKDEFVKACIKYAKRFYGEHPLQNEEYPKIIHPRHFQRLRNLLENQTILYGGEYSESTHKIAPTLIELEDWENPLMQEEIFGPLLPILSFDQTDELFDRLKELESPLACYLFSEDKEQIRRYLDELQFGGGCLNDVIVHVANHALPFGGIGKSGMGRYHGEASFRCFSYQKALLKKTTRFDIDLRYPPYRKKFKILRGMIKFLP